MSNLNQNNQNNQNKNQNLGGNAHMTIKERREQELQQKEAARVAEEKARVEAERKAYLDSIEQKDIVDTIEEIENNVVRAARDENRNVLGINGGQYYQTSYKGTVISAKTLEELETIKERMDNGIKGDGLLHKTVIIDGKSCDCTGRTEEELEADIRAAEEYAAAHRRYSMMISVPVAEELHEAEYKKEDLEQVGERHLIVYPEKRIMGLDGSTVVDLDDLHSNLEKEDVKTLLTERLNNALETKTHNYNDEDDYDDDYDYDDDDYGYDEAYDEGYDNGYKAGYCDGYEDGLEDGE